MPPGRVAYRLDSTWRVAAPVPAVWRVLADPAFTWSDWWPLLATEQVTARTRPDGSAAPGARAALRVRSPFGRTLHLRIEVTAVEPPRDDGGSPAGHRRPDPAWLGHARLTVDGDLVGTALVIVRAAGRGTVVALRWDVTPAPWRPDLSAAPRVSASAHALVMRVGELGLRRHLRHIPDDGVSRPSSCPWRSSSSWSPPSGAAPP